MKNLGEHMMNTSLSRLNHIRRYSSHPVVRVENVAEHSFWITYFSYVIAYELKQKGMKVNFEKVIKNALMHDLEESQTGDILRTFKYVNSDVEKRMKAAAETVFKRALTSEFLFNPVLGNNIAATWKRAKDKSLEGRIVAFADLVCVLFYCKAEINMGNNYMRKILFEAFGTIVKKYINDETFSVYVQQLEEDIYEYLEEEYEKG